jgi:hypothetical protein
MNIEYFIIVLIAYYFSCTGTTLFNLCNIFYMQLCNYVALFIIENETDKKKIDFVIDSTYWHNDAI